MYPDSNPDPSHPPPPNIPDDLAQELASVAELARRQLDWLADRQRARRIVDAEELHDRHHTLHAALTEATAIARAIMDSTVTGACPLCRPATTTARLASAPRRAPQPAPRWRPSWQRSTGGAR